MTFLSASETSHVTVVLLVPLCWLGCARIDGCRFDWFSLAIPTETPVFRLQVNSLIHSTNELMNFITYIPHVKPEGQAQGCILWRSMVINPLGNDSPVRM